MKNKAMTFGCVVLSCLLLTAPSVANRSLTSKGRETDEPFETRCGWFSNPTPANIWLYDRDAHWTIGVQGGYQVEDDWDWPKFKPGQWVRANGSYGYGCACLQVQVDQRSHEVRKIKSAQARPLAACRQDQSLKRWKRLLK